MGLIPMTPAVPKSPEEILKGLRRSVADVESLVMAYGSFDTGMSTEIEWRKERTRRIHLVNVLRRLQHDLEGVRHLMARDTSEAWTRCIDLVDAALKGEGK